MILNHKQDNLGLYLALLEFVSMKIIKPMNGQIGLVIVFKVDHMLYCDCVCVEKGAQTHTPLSQLDIGTPT